MEESHAQHDHRSYLEAYETKQKDLSTLLLSLLEFQFKAKLLNFKSHKANCNCQAEAMFQKVFHDIWGT